MGDVTGIEWTDSTMNFWEGCQKVGPGCDHCYAETRNVRFTGGANWGPGAPRRRMSEHTRHNAKRWHQDSGAFIADHGRHQRVFCSSLSDIFDNAVPAEWRTEAFDTMAVCNELRWQLLTKRVGNVEKMVPFEWLEGHWPAHVGLMITVVTQDEIDRDVPKLRSLKERFGIPWVGLSVEPLIEPVKLDLDGIDWVIVGGESGPGARRFEAWWAAAIVQQCQRSGVACFVKQMGEHYTLNGEVRKLADKKGHDMSEWPESIRVRQFPAQLS